MEYQIKIPKVFVDTIKLNGIEDGAQKNVNADWTATDGDAEILNKPILEFSSNIPLMFNMSPEGILTVTY